MLKSYAVWCLCMQQCLVKCVSSVCSHLLPPLYRWRCMRRPAPWQTRAQPGSGPHMCGGLHRSWYPADALQQQREGNIIFCVSTSIHPLNILSTSNSVRTYHLASAQLCYEKQDSKHINDKHVYTQHCTTKLKLWRWCSPHCLKNFIFVKNFLQATGQDGLSTGASSNN